jgi:branched-chain amino acid transport system permease protein
VGHLGGERVRQREAEADLWKVADVPERHRAVRDERRDARDDVRAGGRRVHAVLRRARHHPVLARRRGGGGTVLRECIRLFYPGGSQPKLFPALLPTSGWNIGAFHLRFDNVILLVFGALLIAGTHLIITRTRLGLAIRAVAQDEETARTMGIDFRRVVLVTFALGSALAAFAGVMDGLYYNEVYFGMGLLLGVIGFAAAILGGLGNMYGAIVGGFLFAALQTIGAAALPFASAYRDVFAFGVVIVLMALRPTGLIGEQVSERV